MTIFEIISPVARKMKNKQKEAELYKLQLKNDLDLITGRIAEIQETFDLVADSELIEAMIYEELSLKARYAYLLRLAKEKNLSCQAVSIE